MSGTIAAGSLVEYGYTSEVVFGSTPTGRAFKKVRDVGFSLNLQKEIHQSEERKTDRMRQDARHGYRSVAGEVNGDISEQSWDDFIEAVIGGTWANITPVSTTLNISINSTTNKITSLTSSFDFLTSGITVGDVFFVVTNPGPVSGFSGEYLTVLSATASTIEVEPNTITTTAASVSVARIYEVGRKVSIGNTYRSFTFERWLTDRNLYQQFRGVRINQVTFSIPASGLASLTFGVLGQDATIFSSTTVASVYSEAPQTTPFAAVNGALFEGGQVLGLVTAAEITLNNNMASSQVVGSNIVPDILFGRYADVTGTITVLFSDASALNKFVDQTESSLVIRLQNKDVLDQDTQFINLVLPRIKYSGGDIDDGVEGGVTLTLPFIALAPLSINPAQGSTSLFIQTSNVVPRTEVFSFLSGVPSGWTYSRASNATYFSSTGVLTVASAGVARVDHNPDGLAVRGLLLEPSRTNLALNSNDALGGGLGVSVAVDQITAPNGGLADFVQEDTTNGEHYAGDRNINVESGKTYCWSFFAKQGVSGSPRRAYVRTSLQGPAGVIFNLTTGAGSVVSTPVSYGSQNVGNGWWRCHIVFTATGTGTAVFRQQIVINADNNTYTGDGVSGIYFWGAQLEEGTFPSSYIPTSGATVTRAADRLTYDLAANAPWFQSSSGYTYSLDFISSSNSQGVAVFLGTAAGSFDNTSYLTSAFNYRVNTNGMGASLSLNTELQINKAAVSINYSGARFGLNNNTRLISNQGYPLMTTFAVLSSPWLATNFAAGWARSVALSNYYYSDAELKALVT